MKHIKALIIKFVLVAFILELVLLYLTNLTFQDILLISLAVTALSYIIGDLFIFHASNNTAATIADIGLSFLTVYVFKYIYLNSGITFLNSIIAAVVVGIWEWIFHKYILRTYHKAKG